MTDRWLDARIAAPVAGMFSNPVISGRPKAFRKGPAIAREIWYCTSDLSCLYLGIRPATEGPAKALPRYCAASPATDETDEQLPITSDTANGRAATGTITRESSASPPVTNHSP